MSAKLRVLHVVTDMGRGGLETMLMNYYRKIDRNIIQFDFLVHRKERAAYDQEIEKLGGRIYRLPKLNPCSCKYLKELQDFFEQHREYKIVHSHIDCMSAIPLRAAKKSGIPIRIAHSHNSNQEKNLKYILKMYFKHQIPMYATNLLACGETAGKWMFEKKKFGILPNAIDTKQYEYNSLIRKRIRSELEIEDNVVLGHVGNFSYAKNHVFLIEVFKILVQKNSQVKLLLVGGGPLLPTIEKLVIKEGLNEKVLFLGVRSDVAALMQAMDIFILPSLYEGLPVTMIEAQTSGLPCIISNRVPIECQITELVQQISLKKSAEEWAIEVLKQMNYVRENHSNEIRQSGYDIYDNVLKLQCFYQELVEKRK